MPRESSPTSAPKVADAHTFVSQSVALSQQSSIVLCAVLFPKEMERLSSNAAPMTAATGLHYSLSKTAQTSPMTLWLKAALELLPLLRPVHLVSPAGVAL